MRTPRPSPTHHQVEGSWLIRDQDSSPQWLEEGEVSLVVEKPWQGYLLGPRCPLHLLYQVPPCLQAEFSPHCQFLISSSSVLTVTLLSDDLIYLSLGPFLAFLPGVFVPRRIPLSSPSGSSYRTARKPQLSDVNRPVGWIKSAVVAGIKY